MSPPILPPLMPPPFQVDTSRLEPKKTHAFVAVRRYQFLVLLDTNETERNNAKLVGTVGQV